MTDARFGRRRDGDDLATAIVDVFESNPFRTANVVTLEEHLAARGVDVSELEVRDHCERLVEADVLEFDQSVYDRATYSYTPE